MGITPINTIAIQKAVHAKAQVRTGKSFDAFLGVADAMGGTATTAGHMYGSPNAATVLSSAFSGISQLSGMSGGGAYPSYAGMNMGGYAGPKNAGAYMPSGIPGGGSDSVIPGAEGFSQWDMINTMNQNNLQLLELQATMQSNMQGWNTKSNILSADHRARMAMIEKFTARG